MANVKPASTGDISSGRDQEPILVVATGGSSGLGFEALQDFVIQSERSIILVLGCRSPTRHIVSETFSSLDKVHKLDIVELDLTSHDSIRGFAAHVLETYSQEISVVLLCAGAIYSKHTVDTAGAEMTLQVNVLSQALLLQCLWARLVEPAARHRTSPRIVFVASSLHKKAAQQHEVSPSTVDALLDNKHWKSMPAYSISKLVQMHLFQIVVDAFNKIEDREGRPVAIAVSPGFVPQTGLVRDYYWWTRLFMTYIMPLLPFTTSLQDGGKVIAQAMIDQNLESGLYISPRGSESLAQVCLDTSLRSTWHDWLISKGVWGH